MSETTRRIHTTVLGYFLRGLLLLVPITLMVWAIWQSLAYLDSIIKTDIPGLGLLILLGIIVLSLVVLSGWTYRRTAALLQVSPMTVQRRLKRGLALLKDGLHAPGADFAGPLWPLSRSRTRHRVASAAPAC